MNNYNIDNIFSTTLRDTGEVALIDGDTKKIINIVKTGYAVHISRTSASGRYVYMIGRDGKINLIDLWMEKPDNVAEIRIGLEARSVETSRARATRTSYAIAGSYWPPQYVIMKGDTLEPLKIVGTRGMTVGDQEYHPEPRVASIVGSHFKPEFVVNVKETGKILLVDYPDINKLQDHRDRGRELPARRRLGLDQALLPGRGQPVEQDRGGGHQGRQARQADRRRQDPAPRARRELRASEVRPGVGDRPPRQREDRAHRHRSGEAQGQRLEGRADAQGPGRRLPVHQDAPEVEATCGSTRRSTPIRRSASRSRCSTSTTSTSRHTVLPIAEWAELGEGAKRVVQPEYNKAGDEVWFAVWSAKNQRVRARGRRRQDAQAQGRDQGSADRTPTGHFNVYNTQHDIY